MLKKLTSNIAIYGGTNAIKSLVPLLMLPILTVYLTPADYGVLSLVEVSILFLAPFITLNSNSAINLAYFKLSQIELKKYISNAILLSICATIFMLLIIYIFSEYINNFIKLDINLLYLLPIFAFLRLISSIVLTMYRVQDKAKNFAYYTFLQTIIDLAISYGLVVYFNFGYIGRLDGIYGSFFISTIIGIYILYRQGYIDFKAYLSYSTDILQYGLPLIPHVLGGVILAMSDRYFISYYINTTEIGYYTVAYQISSAMLLVGVSVNQAWSPMLFRFLENYKKNKSLIIKYTTLLFLLFLFSGISIYLFSDILFNLFVDESFFRAKEYFPYLLIGFMFQSFYYLFTNFLFYYKKTVLLAKLTFFSAILNIILNYIFITTFGAIGVAYATAITYIIYLFVVLGFVIKGKYR